MHVPGRTALQTPAPPQVTDDAQYTDAETVGDKVGVIVAVSEDVPVALGVGTLEGVTDGVPLIDAACEADAVYPGLMFCDSVRVREGVTD